MKAAMLHHGGGVLIPSDPDDEAWLELPRGEYMVSVTKPRNLGNHKRLFGGLLKCLMEKCDLFHEQASSKAKLKECWLSYLMIAAGYCDTLITPTGEVYKVRHSVSWEKMDEVEFREVFSAMVAAAVRVVPEHLADEINQF